MMTTNSDREKSQRHRIRRFLPERDGILNALLLANVMAEEKKPLGQLVATCSLNSASITMAGAICTFR